MAIPNIFQQKKKGFNTGFLAGSYEMSVESLLTEPQSKVRKFFMTDFIEELVSANEKAKDKRELEREKKAQQMDVSTANNNVGGLKDLGAENLKEFNEQLGVMSNNLYTLAKIIENDIYNLQYIPQIALSIKNTFNELSYEFSQGESSNMKIVNESIGGFASAMLAIASSADDIERAAKSLQASKASFQIMASIVNGLSKLNHELSDFDSEKLNAVSRSMVVISASIGILGLSVWAFSELVSPDMLLLPLVAITALSGINAIASRFSGDGDNKGLLAMSASIGILGLSLWAFSELVEPQHIFAPILALTGLAAATFLMSKASGDNLKTNSLVIGAASIGVLGLSIWAFNELIDDYDMLYKPMLAMMGLATTLFIVAKAGKNVLKGSLAMAIGSLTLFVLAEGISYFDDVKDESMKKAGLAVAGLTLALVATGINGKNVLMGSAAMIVGSLSVGILAEQIKRYDTIEYDTMTKAALAVGGLTLALAATGTSGVQVLLGSAAMLVGSVSVGILAENIKKFEGVTTEHLTNAALSVSGLGLAMAAVGAVGVLSLLGAGALIAGGLSLHVIVGAIRKFDEVKEEHIEAMNNSITGVGFSLAKIGNPFTVAFTIAGAGALSLSAMGLSAFVGSLKTIKDSKITVKDSINASSITSIFVDKITDTFDRNKDKMHAARLGIYALSGIGTLLSDLAKGVQSMANLTFTEYMVSGGKIVPKSIVNLTNEHFNAVGRNVGYIINALNDPLARAGQNASIFGNTPVGLGIKNLTGLGGVLTNLAKGVSDMANLTFVEYEVKNGKIQPKSIVKLDNSHFKMVALNTSAIISSLTEPLANAGKGGSFFSSESPIGKGIRNLTGIGAVLTGLAKGVSGMANLRFEEYSVKDGKLVLTSTRQLNEQDFANVGVNVGRIISALVNPLEKIAEMDMDDAKAGIKIGNSISKFMSKTASATSKFNETFAKTPIDTFKTNFSGYMETVGKSMLALHKTFNEETEKGGIVTSFNKILTGSSKLSANMKGVANGFERSAKANKSMIKSIDSLNLDHAKSLEAIVTSIKDKEFSNNIRLLTNAIGELSKSNTTLGTVIGGKSELDKVLEKDDKGKKDGNKSKKEDVSMVSLLQRQIEIQTATARDMMRIIAEMQSELRSIKSNQVNGSQVTKTKPKR